MITEEHNQDNPEDDRYNLQSHEGVIVETFYGSILFRHKPFNLRETFKTWISQFLEDGCGISADSLTAWLEGLNVTHVETGKKASREELQDTVKRYLDSLSDEQMERAIKLWEQHLPSKLEEAISELLDGIYTRVAVDLLHTGQPGGAEAHYFDKLITDFEKSLKERFKVRGRGGKPRKLSDDELRSLRGRYQKVLSECKKIKEHHDTDFERFKEDRQRKGYSIEEWRKAWLEYAPRIHTTIKKEFLPLFAARDNYHASASEIAYRIVAKEAGYKVSYAKKLMSQVSKSAEVRDEADIDTKD